MKLVDELVPLRLYKSKKKFYMPFSPNNKKRSSAILLMGQTQEESEKMMNLPYLYNPNHMFRAYYIDRNAMNYIDSSLINDDNDYDEVSEAAISEAMWHRTDSKFNIDNGSTMDERIIKKVYNGDTVKYILKRTNIKEAPDTIDVIVYPSIAAIRKDMPESLKDSGKDVYSYTTGNTIHILSYLVYDPKNMDGPYEIYLLNELIFCIIMNAYPEINSNIAMCAAMAISGQVDWWIEEKKKKDEVPYFLMAQYINEIYKEKGSIGVHRILNGDFRDIQISMGHKALKLIKQYYKKPLFEGKLETKERNKLDDNKFGIPSKRKYPMPDAAHVKAAIKMFNHCDKEDEAELARNIKKFAKEYGVEVNPGPDNRLSKYVRSSKNEMQASQNGIYSGNEGIWNSIVVIDGKLFRERVEGMIFNNKGQVLLRKAKDNPNSKYIGPGGSTEKDISMEEQLANECREEVRLNIGDIEFVNSYKYILPKEKVEKMKSWSGVEYYGMITYLFIAKAKSKYTGTIRDVDKDPGMLNNSKWYDIEDVYNDLDENQKMAIDKYRGINNESTLLESNNFSDKADDVKKVIKNLSKEESDHVGGGYWVDSNHVIYRKVEYDNNKPIGFIDVYLLPRYKRTGLIVLAVSKDARGKGIGKKLVNSAIRYCKTLDNIDQLRWLADSDNDASINMAKSLKFSLKNDGVNEKEFVYSLSESQAPKILYHGSHKKLTKLIAHDSGVSGNYVFGADDYKFALTYAGNQWNDLQINQAYYNGQYCLTEIEKGAFKKVFDTNGYVYYLDGAGFKVPEYSERNKHEWVSDKSVVPFKVDKIDNVLEAIEDNPDIKLYRYPDLPPFIKDRDEYISKKKKLFGIDESQIDYLFDGTPIVANHDPKYLDILRILQDFTYEEFERVSFNPTYKESQWIEKRIVEYDTNGQPMSFLDVYHFPVNPDVAYITCGVHPLYRGHHLAQIMLQKLIDSGYHIENNIKKYIWHVHVGNEASEKTAIHANFKKPSDKLDKYGRMTYELDFSTEEDDKPTIPYKESSIDDEYDTSYKEGVYILDESSMMLIDEAEKKFDQKFKKFLYRERIRNAQSIMKIYIDVKQRNPMIDRTYRSLDKYKNLNLFVDTFYYHELYLKHTPRGTKKAMEMYWDFLMRLMKNDDIDEQYLRKTYFFPVMKSRFVQSADDILDWKKNLNLFSCIEYFSKKNPRLLDALNGRTIMCLGDNGYFKIESIAEWNPAIRSRLKRNLNRILAGGEIAIDDEDEEGDIPDENVGAANMAIDAIEDKINIRIDSTKDASTATPSTSHLVLNDSTPEIFDSNKDSENTVAFMMIAKDSKQAIDMVNNLKVDHLKDVQCYYKPR